jgi:hypothetical protein
MLKRMLLLAAIAACHKKADRCGDAIDDGFARKHAQRQTGVRRDAAQRERLLAAQRFDDETADDRRAFLVKHCVDDNWSPIDRDCVARGQLGQLGCLDSSELRELDDDVPDDELQAWERFTDRMCACTDRECAERVELAKEIWGGRGERPDQASSDYQRRIERYARHYADCMADPEPPPPPDAPPACDAYFKLVASLQGCERMDREDRDAMATSAAEVRRDLSGADTTGFADICRMRIESVSQDARASGCLAGADDVPPGCARYIRAVETLVTCDKMPAASRDAVRQGLDAMRSGWHFGDLPPDARKTAIEAADAACNQGTDAIRQAMKATGCSL